MHPTNRNPKANPVATSLAIIFNVCALVAVQSTSKCVRVKSKSGHPFVMHIIMSIRAVRLSGVIASLANDGIYLELFDSIHWRHDDVIEYP